MAIPTPNFIDRLVGWIDPRAGRERLYHRTLLDHARMQTRAFEAASKSDGWTPRRAGASGDADVSADAATVRIKARHLRDNIGFVARGLQSRVDYAIGTGVVRKWGGPHAAKLDKAWRAWCRVADSDGARVLAAIEAAALNTTDVDGGVLLRLRPRLPEDGLPVPLQVQLLEVDWIDDSRIEPSRSGNVVINGIEYDQIGRRVGWWLFDEHPGAGHVGRLFTGRGLSKLVPAAQIIPLDHIYRPGQRRGVSRLAPVINAVRDLHLLHDAELARRNIESRLGVVASGDVTAMASPIDPVKLKQGDLGDLPSGGIVQLPPGLNLTSVAPNAAPGYIDTVKFHTKLICAAGGWTYEAATGDMTEVNYSSARVRRLDLRSEIERLQWLTLDPFLCGIDDAFVAAAKLSGLIPPSAQWACDHTYPRWPHVDPVKDVSGEVMEIAAGLRSISEGVRSRGDDPEKVHADLAADASRLRGPALDLMTLLRWGHEAGAQKDQQ